MFGFTPAVIALFSLAAGFFAWNSAVAARSVPQPTANVAVGPQYDSTQVYVAPGDLDVFVASSLPPSAVMPATRSSPP